jgi:hypothetical protein
MVVSDTHAHSKPQLELHLPKGKGECSRRVVGRAL